MHDGSEKKPLFTGSIADREFAREISQETLVRLLVSKGLLSVQELLDEEKKTRAMTLQQEPHETGRIKTKGLRRMAAKHRWSRHVTSFLFGWQWKKIKSGDTPVKTTEQ